MVTFECPLTVEQLVDVKFAILSRVTELNKRALVLDGQVGVQRVINSEINTLKIFLECMDNCKGVDYVETESA